MGWAAFIVELVIAIAKLIATLTGKRHWEATQEFHEILDTHKHNEQGLKDALEHFRDRLKREG